MYPISSNHYSTDLQLLDALGYLSDEERKLFNAEFPEWPALVWSNSWVDAEASGVDVEYTSWVIDWVERNTSIFWEDGEPWMLEDSDALDIEP